MYLARVTETKGQERWEIVWILLLEWIVLSIHKSVPVSDSDLLFNLFWFGKLFGRLFLFARIWILVFSEVGEKLSFVPSLSLFVPYQYGK